jgi:hypothetical protein
MSADTESIVEPHDDPLFLIGTPHPVPLATPAGRYTAMIGRATRMSASGVPTLRRPQPAGLGLGCNSQYRPNGCEEADPYNPEILGEQIGISSTV